jgi:Ca-activated chloride channel family protein
VRASASSLVLALVLLPAVVPARAGFWEDLLLTPDQQAQRAFEAGAWSEAAERFTDPERRGASLYRAGEFELAAAAFARSSSPEAAFDRGNALMLLGRYPDAIAAYDRALAQRSGWREALENRQLAVLRRDRLLSSGDDAGGTGGKLGADEIVLESSARMRDAVGEEQVPDDARTPLSDAALRALWLRRVDTRPRDFLRARFAVQLRSRGDGEPAEGADVDP